MEAGADNAASRVWIPGIIERIAAHLPVNDVASTLRTLDKATLALLRDPRNAAVRLSQPVPPGAFAQKWGAPGAVRSLTRAQRAQLVSLTAASGSLHNLRIAEKAAECGKPAQALEAAAGAGQLHVCAYLLQRGYPLGESLRCAAAKGQRAACDWLLANGCAWDGAALCAAARGGHAELLVALAAAEPAAARRRRASPLVGRWEVLEAVAEGCSLAVLQRLMGGDDGGDGQVSDVDGAESPLTAASVSSLAAAAEEEDPTPSVREQVRRRELAALRTRVLAAAAGSPTPDWRAKLTWLEGLGWPLGPEACAAAAGRPDALERLAWLHQWGYPADAGAAEAAAAAGNEAALSYMLSYLQAAGGVGGATPLAAYRAACGGHLGCLMLLHAAGCRWPSVRNRGYLEVVAANGDLDMVAWMLEVDGNLRNGLYGHNSTAVMLAAARSGSLALLRWLRERSGTWGEGAFVEAVACGCSEEALEWLVESGCPMPSDGGPYVRAAHVHDLPVLRCLARLSCPWGPAGEAFNRALRQRCGPEQLGWLLDAGCPVDWPAAFLTVGECGAGDGGGGCAGDADAGSLAEWLKRRQRQLAGGASAAAEAEMAEAEVAEAEVAEAEVAEAAAPASWAVEAGERAEVGAARDAFH
ncbi:hypothetical protein GPECTOR_18g176 [Gonium pectorale]|uniref:Uncharacterized protein n=1 Tax=Gonium pectorale TaxID=33097 RepID=A0A150GJP0_GONPE|nr:hypothetical protein GPECTOR_18g176 [Gonium pectorale]|eukprot:KXZ50023.1 hypothetical protein GPECTOR_18g176 [Gonium pectorale]